MALPPPSANQPFCDVSALEAGLIELPDEMFISNATPGKVTTAPSLSFLLNHSTTGQKFVFDLGIRKDWENYPPVIVDWIHNVYRVHVKQDVAESIVKGGASLSDIAYVCLSHVHWDHTGDTQPFTNSTFLVGGACESMLKSTYPEDPKGRFASDLLPQGRTKFLNTSDSEWKPIGPFPRALDFFKDGSLFIIDSPGHLAGHVNILARTSQDGGWIYLAGDSAHHRNLITLESEVAVGHPGHVHICAHEDKEAAEEHIRRINELMKIPGVQVLLAHDEPFYNKNKDGPAFWPGKIPSL
ncbi:Metallo-hydrolase/oxidoreductase [Flammula alnicola]|nr:Metallo-hydrolase/oxidoreductase [Flammula alnicola]